MSIVLRRGSTLLLWMFVVGKSWAANEDGDNPTAPVYSSASSFLTGNLGAIELNGGMNKSLAFYAVNRPNFVKEAALESLQAVLQERLSFTGDETILPTDGNVALDKEGNLHVRFKQFLDGLPVEGASMMMHFRGKDGLAYALNGEFHSSEALDPTTAELDCEEAVEKAWSEVLATRNISSFGEWKSDCERAAVQGRDGKPYLTYKRLRGYQPAGDGAPYQRDLIFASRSTGALVAVHPRVFGARALQTYDCQGLEADQPSQCILKTSSPNKISTSDVILNDAHNYVMDSYDFYKSQFNRDSMDDNGLVLRTLVHYGVDLNNAFFTDEFGGLMGFGDGDGVFYKHFAQFDVAVHEFSHGVTHFTSSLVYQDESGAMNEAFSDCMAAAAERLLLGSSVTDVWLIGEDVILWDLFGDALRDMADPPSYGDPDHYSDRSTDASDNGGVHTNSGIMNKAFVLMTQGGLHPKSNILVPPLNSNFDLSIKAAAKILYDANTKCLTESSDYQAARECTLLFATPSQVTSVSKAWEAVGVKGDLPLTNGVTKTDFSLDFDKDYQVFVLDQEVDVGNTVTCQLQGFNGDPDLSIRLGRRPALYPKFAQNDCYSASAGTTEACTTAPASIRSKVYVAVESFEASSGLTLTCVINGPTAGTTRAPTKTPTRPPTKKPTKKPTKAPTSCKPKNNPCTNRSQCCVTTPPLTCDGALTTSRTCKICKKRSQTCQRSSQCCSGLKCKNNRCMAQRK